MAASNFTPIQLYRTDTPGGAPTAGNLAYGELAINYADGKLFYKDSTNAVKILASNAAVTNVASINFGTTGLTPATATTGAVTVAGTLAVTNGGTGAATAADARTNLSVPSATGGGASGTWGINISGNAATATSATSATSATTAGNVSGVVGAANGGTGVANNAANTVTFSGNYGLTLTLSNTTSVTLPTSGTLSTLAGAETLTNKRINPRVSSTATASSVTPDISTFDQYCFTALAEALTIGAPTGTPVNGNKLLFRILDNGTSRALTWNGTYTAIGVTLPTATNTSKMLYVGCVYNAANTRWDVVAVATQA